VRRWRVPPGSGAFSHLDAVRVDSGVAEGDEVGTHYDPMIAKVSGLCACTPVHVCARVRVCVYYSVAVMAWAHTWIPCRLR
jgi:acetyl/propionyl-CoA carboxylase alpha subunit